MRPSCVLALDDAGPLGSSIARQLGVPIVPDEVRRYPNGELRSVVPVDAAGRAVAVVQSLHGDAEASVHDRLCRLLFTIAALRDVPGSTVIAVAPYLCYSRQDRRSRPGQALASRYVAELLEAAGANAVVTLEVHNLAAFENAFRCPAVHVEAAELFADHPHRAVPAGNRLVVVAPDAGSVKRAERVRAALSTRRDVGQDVAFLQKRRVDSVIARGELVGDVGGAAAVIVDDQIATGETIARAASACRRAGAANVRVAVTHAAFVGEVSVVLADVDELVVTDSIPSTTSDADGDMVTVLPRAAPLAAALSSLGPNSAA